MPLKPLSDNEIDDQQRALIAPFVRTGRDHAVFRTMLRHPDAMQAFLGWGQYILSENNSLSSRQRELLILWVGAARNCEYEFLRHAKIARRLGFSEDELRRLATGDGSGWPASEQLLLAAADQLLTIGRVTEPTFAELITAIGEHSAIDLVWTVGQYAQVCMFLLTAGVTPDEDIADDPLRQFFTSVG
ncbi:carboxymuconolactone decarboxylase family protein [Sphingomonas sp.]|jgi:alkylhydroperoxidase family enzyme|uniref:carboxymuconolactone decarboxylase family protein n=1 Tax=Sphingomonadales TaxID=204457 RepID=UPI0035C873D1